MPVALKSGDLQGAVLHDEDGNPITSTLDGAKRRLDVSGIISDVSPGTTITTGADTVVGIGATVALPAVAADTRRMTVQVTGGDVTTRIRVREVGAGAGRGLILSQFSSASYGTAGGAIAALEVENVAGPASAVVLQFERD